PPTSVTHAATTAAATTIALVTRFVDGNRTTVDLSPIQGFDRGAGLVIVSHRDKGKTARPAGIAVRDHGDFFHLTMGPKLGLQRFLGRGKGKVANIQLHLRNSKTREPVSTL